MTKLKLKYFLDTYRPNYWFKNVFMLVGSFSAFFVFDLSISAEKILNILIAFICTSFAASANYGINELLDSEYDKHHPTKRHRAIPSGKISGRGVILGSIAFALASLLISYFYLPFGCFFAILSLMVMGVLYNIKPIRTKEVPYLDVISESINNPIRFVIGWYAVNALFFPPASFLISFWAFGAFLMACKRLAEYRFINDPEAAARYRKSFKHYNEDRLTISIIGYISITSFALAIICIKYFVSLVLAAPVFAVSFIWYFRLTLIKDSPVKEPEKLVRMPSFYLFTLLVILAVVLGKYFHSYIETFIW